MLVIVKSIALEGVEALEVSVEVNVTNRGLPRFDIVGLPNKAVEESRQRVLTALTNSKIDVLGKKITINLAPADLPKEGSFYDLPIAVGVMSANYGLLPDTRALFFGEVSLDGSLRYTKGVMVLALYARENGFLNIFVPQVNSREACMVEGLKVFGVKNLDEMFLHLSGKKLLSVCEKNINPLDSKEQDTYPYDEIIGQEVVKRALSISAAGSHTLLMIGPPGAGKTLLAKALPSLLPNLNFWESLEVTKIYSSVGRLNTEDFLLARRPFRSVGPTLTSVGLLGGGVVPRPGEVSLAHRGVLFMDEFCEFSSGVLESLRQPLEEGRVLIARGKRTIAFPCRFTLVAASNPCPCGYLNHMHLKCKCSPSQILRYRQKLSGPLMDRIDLYTNVFPVDTTSMLKRPKELQAEKLRAFIRKAREVQEARFVGEGIYCNSDMSLAQVKKYCELDQKTRQLLEKASVTFRLSARSYLKVIRVARTIADMEGLPKISYEHLAEALQYRYKEEKS